MLPRWYEPPALQCVSGRQIIERVARLHGVTAAEITGPSRVAYLCAARRQVMHELRGRGLSTPAIGRILNRDHTTVLHGLGRLGKQTSLKEAGEGFQRSLLPPPTPQKMELDA